MLRFAAILSLLSVGVPICGAEPQPAPGQNQESRQQAPRPVKQPLLKKVFRSQYSKEQLAQFKKTPTLEQLVQAMSPEQRQAARAGLAGLEAKAKTPDELAQIARGYLLLDEQGPDCGQDVFRVAAQLERLDPSSPAAPTLVAEAFFKRGDYPSATKLAEEALKRNQEDPGANAIFNLSEGRRGPAKQGDGGAPHASVSLSSLEEALPKRLDPAQTIKPVVQGKRNPIAVPSLAKTDAGAESEKPASLPPLPLAMALLGLAFVGYGVYRARKSGGPEDSSPDPSAAPVSTTHLATEVPIPQTKETKPSPRNILDIADRHVAGAKTFVQDHPVASATAAIVTLAVIIRVGGPLIAAGGGAAAGTEIVAGSGGAAALGQAAVKVMPMPAIEAWWARVGVTVGALSSLVMKGDSNASASQSQPGSGGQAEHGSKTPRNPAEDKGISPSTTDDLLNAGEQPDRNGLTKAGRALQKHGHRQGSAYPRVNGKELNDVGREVLKDIVSDPKSGRRAGKYLDIISPNGRGARFTPDGKRFIGFLEP